MDKVKLVLKKILEVIPIVIDVLAWFAELLKKFVTAPTRMFRKNRPAE